MKNWQKWGKMNDFLSRITFQLVPFHRANYIWRSLDKEGQSILDVGCGRGKLMSLINIRQRFVSVGLDIFRPYLEEAMKRSAYSDCVLCDVRKMPFQEKSFDIVLCLNVLEHIDEEEGIRLIADLEKIARRQVVVSAPIDFMKATIEEDGNPHSIHRSGWTPVEFKKSGFKVKTCGLCGVNGDQGLIEILRKWLYPFPTFIDLVGATIDLLTMPIGQLFPQWAETMICVKELSSGERVQL